jgi:hypothetical protein
VIVEVEPVMPEHYEQSVSEFSVPFAALQALFQAYEDAKVQSAAEEVRRYVQQQRRKQP